MSEEQLRLFIPLRKVDEANRLVYGIAAEEIPDRPKGETFDYASSKPNILAWSNEFAKITEGKSFGNLRAMHQNVSAGRLTDIRFDDAAKKIEVVAEVVDDKEWEKVCKGVYTGFSFGGSYGRKWIDDQGNKRYTAVPTELSLGDYPAIPTAHFTMVKIGGEEIEVPFAATPEDARNSDLLAKIAVLGITPGQAEQALTFLAANAGQQAVLNPLSEYGQSVMQKRDFSQKEREKDAGSGKAMSDGAFPIENSEDLKNAIKAYGRAKDKDAAKKHIMKRAKSLGLEKELPEDWGSSAAGQDKSKGSGEKKESKEMKKIASAEDLKKYLGQEVWDVRQAINALDYLYSLFSGEASETHPEAASQAADLKEAIARIKSFIASEIQEADESMTKTAGTEDLAKVGASISASNKKTIQAIHDHASALGATCSGMSKTADAGSLAKIQGLEADLQKIAGERDALQARVDELEKEPEPAKGALTDLFKVVGVSKDDETGALGSQSAPDPNDPVALIKNVHATGGMAVLR